MNTPSTYTPTAVVEMASSISTKLPSGKWVPARPSGWSGLSLRKRLKAAWMVFTGKADVLRWEGQ